MLRTFEQLKDDCESFWCPSTIHRISDPNPDTFFKEYVSTGTPVVITGIQDEWAYPQNWSKHALDKLAGNEYITVDVTPDGYGDSVKSSNGIEVFIKPHERKMTLREFLRSLDDNSFNGVPYLSNQNSNLSKEMTIVSRRVPSCLPLGKTFGSEPEAINIWIGDERAVSSCHKDHYENLYCVLEGEKHFLLFPPSDILFLYQRKYQSARYTFSENEGWGVSMENTETPWISIDPLNIDVNQYPLIKFASPRRVVVRPGETLYLPSLWYHHVSQQGYTVAVNYWHDMKFDRNYIYHNFFMGIAPKLVQLLEDGSIESNEESSQ